MIPWKSLLQFGLGYLKLSPDAFWNLTLRELDAAIEWSFPKQHDRKVPTTTSLETLIKTYPDNQTEI